MAPKKRPSRNGYYYFMEKYRNDNNHKYPNNPITLSEAGSMCSPLWQAMTPEERKVYDDIAKREKQRVRGMEVKFTTTGIALSDVERKQMEHQEYCRKVKEDIKNMVTSLNLTDLLEKKFYFIHVNYFCQCDNGDFIHAEVGVSCFSLKNGIDDYYHSMIAPGNLPIGYTFKAQKHSEETHGIPLPPSEIGEWDYAKLFMDIYRFVKPGTDDDGPPIVYTVNEFEPCVTNFLEKISHAGGYSQKHFRVYDLVTMFFELRNKAASFSESEGFPVLYLAEKEIENDAFAYTKDICCYWHEGSEAPQHCSLSRARRWGFHIADHCSKDLNVVLIPGKHLPTCDKYWDDNPLEGFRKQRNMRKKAASRSEASGGSSVVDELPVAQPLRQPKSLGIAVATARAQEGTFDESDFPPIGRRIGAKFSKPA